MQFRSWVKVGLKGNFMIQGYRFVASEVKDLTGFPTDTKGNLLYGHVRENSLQCCPNVNNHEIDCPVIDAVSKNSIHAPNDSYCDTQCDQMLSINPVTNRN